MMLQPQRRCRVRHCETGRNMGCTSEKPLHSPDSGDDDPKRTVRKILSHSKCENVFWFKTEFETIPTEILPFSSFVDEDKKTVCDALLEYAKMKKRAAFHAQLRKFMSKDDYTEAMGKKNKKQKTGDENIALTMNQVTVAQLIGFFFVTWWAVCADLGTYHKPFAVCSNGYFALWTGFLVLLHMFASLLPTKDSTDGMGTLGKKAAPLFFAALVLLIATAPYTTNDFSPAKGQVSRHEAGFSLLATIFTLFVTAMMMLFDVSKSASQLLVPVLVLLWAALAGVLTFRGMFPNPGNGYFACYFGLYSAYQMARAGENSVGLNHQGANVLAGLWVIASFLQPSWYMVTVTEPPPYRAGSIKDEWANGMTDGNAYLISVGTVGLGMALFSIFLGIFYPEAHTKEVMKIQGSMITVEGGIGFFLAVWWAAGVAFGTFVKNKNGFPHTAPYTNTNGYFSLWAGFLLSTLQVVNTHGEIVGTQLLALQLFLVSGVLFISGGFVIDYGVIVNLNSTEDDIYPEGLFAFIASATSVVVTLGMFLLDAKGHPRTSKLTALLLLTWACIAGVMTFRGPFRILGNGYISSYLGLAFSLRYASQVTAHLQLSKP